MAKRTTKKTTTKKRRTKKATDPDLAHIAEPLRPYAIPIKGLTLDPNNARQHNKRNLDTIRDMLQRFGQRRPIIVQKEGMIVRAGNGRTHIARDKLGWTHIAAIVVSESDVEATAYALADNRSAELARWDTHQLAKTLTRLSEDGYDLKAIGFLKYETDPLFDADWDSLTSATPKPTENKQDHAHTIHLTHDQRDTLDAITETLNEDGAERTDAQAITEICSAFMESTNG